MAQGSNFAALGSHVDDLGSTGTTAGLDEIRTALKKKFKITETLNPAVITGVQVERDRKRHWCKLHQGAYTEQVLANHNMTNCKGTDTPLDPGTARAMMLLPTGEVDVEVRRKYQTLVGELRWLLKTRPDLLPVHYMY